MPRMEHRPAPVRHPTAVALSLAAAIGAFAASGPRWIATPALGAAPAAKATCTLVNPAYTGACVETTTRRADETPKVACQPILECLNDSRCAKTYCRSTSVRQGWTLKSAE